MEIFERISGARLHCNLFRPGGFSLLPDSYIFLDILEFCTKFLIRIDEIENLLSFNKI
jgi:NADH:ubiquinone oxidoreductase subunit D